MVRREGSVKRGKEGVREKRVKYEEKKNYSVCMV